MTVCSKCGTEMPDTFDWRTGKFDVEKPTCEACFRKAVSDLCSAIEHAEEGAVARNVFVYGMAQFGPEAVRTAAQDAWELQ